MHVRIFVWGVGHVCHTLTYTHTVYLSIPSPCIHVHTVYAELAKAQLI